MKKSIFAVFAAIVALSATAIAQKAPAARELFLLLPDEYVAGTPADRKAALVFPKSVKPDFLSFMISGKLVTPKLGAGFAAPEGLGDMRVFRGRSGVFVGLRYQIGDGADKSPSVDEARIVTVLLEYKRGVWSDVTAERLPKIAAADAYQTLSGVAATKDLRPEDVWVETQLSRDRSGVMLVGRAKGSDFATPLKFFKWNGSRFVESK